MGVNCLLAVRAISVSSNSCLISRFDDVHGTRHYKIRHTHLFSGRFNRQVLENIRRQSCEGLALPFLLNWLLGEL